MCDNATRRNSYRLQFGILSSFSFNCVEVLGYSVCRVYVYAFESFVAPETVAVHHQKIDTHMHCKCPARAGGGGGGDDGIKYTLCAAQLNILSLHIRAKFCMACSARYKSIVNFVVWPVSSLCNGLYPMAYTTPLHQTKLPTDCHALFKNENFRDDHMEGYFRKKKNSINIRNTRNKIIFPSLCVCVLKINWNEWEREMLGATNHWFKFHSEWYGVWRKDWTIGTDTSYSTWTPLLLLLLIPGELIAMPPPTSPIPFGLATSSDGFELEKLRINLYCCAGSETYSIFDIIFYLFSKKKNSPNICFFVAWKMYSGIWREALPNCVHLCVFFSRLNKEKHHTENR